MGLSANRIFLGKSLGNGKRFPSSRIGSKATGNLEGN